MAFGVIRLSSTGRKCLKCLFVTLSLFMCLLSISLISYGVFITITLAPSLPTEKSIITFIFTIISINGMELLTYYVFGMKVCQKCLNDAHKKHSKYLLKIWMLTGFSTVINVIVIATMAASVSNNLLRSMHYSLERGIRHYLKEPLWKTAIDKLQLNYECCGVNSYKDWHQISWMNIYHFKNDSKTITRHKKYGDNLFLPIMPWSCCKKSILEQCYHDPVQQLFPEGALDTANLLKTINTIGCIEVLRRPLENGFLLFILDTYILFGLQIIISILIKIIYTSSRSACVLGDKQSSSPGWIFGSGTSILLKEFDNLSKNEEQMTEDELDSLFTECGQESTPKTETPILSPMKRIKCKTEVERLVDIKSSSRKVIQEFDNKPTKLEESDSVNILYQNKKPKMKSKKKRKKFNKVTYETLESSDTATENSPKRLEQKLFLS